MSGLEIIIYFAALIKDGTVRDGKRSRNKLFRGGFPGCGRGVAAGVGIIRCGIGARQSGVHVRGHDTFSIRILVLAGELLAIRVCVEQSFISRAERSVYHIRQIDYVAVTVE